jgi:predicted  nucleic acid-binding Zn-ribbon protein
MTAGSVEAKTRIAELQAELNALKQEKARMSDQTNAAEATSQQMAQVIEVAKRKVEKQQTKLKATTARSQRRFAHPLCVLLLNTGAIKISNKRLAHSGEVVSHGDR